MQNFKVGDIVKFSRSGIRFWDFKKGRSLIIKKGRNSEEKNAWTIYKLKPIDAGAKNTIARHGDWYNRSEISKIKI